jgi:hypothetical protein
MMEAIQVFPELMGIAGDLVVKAQDWAGADKMSERLKKTIPPHLLGEEEEGGLGITAEQLQEMQTAIQQGMAEMAELKKQLNDKTIEHQIDMYNAETQRIRALSDNEVDATELNMKGIEQILKYSSELDNQELKSDLADRQVEARKKSTPTGTTRASASGK